MVLRLGAALCGAAIVFCCPNFVNAKLPPAGSMKDRGSTHALLRQSGFAIGAKLQSGVSKATKSKVAGKPASAAKSQPPVVGPVAGKASTYNPLRVDDTTAGGLQTASGENYNPEDWTAAIQTALRGLFKGISFGKAYKPAFALVQVGNKQAVVRINDVGPLKPGRIIDLNERVMRYFDPSMSRGLLPVTVTPLAGSQVPGPVNRRVAS